MCDPVTITAAAIAGLSGAEAVASYVGQKNDAEYAYQQQQKAFLTNRKDNLEASKFAFHDLSLAELEHQTATSESLFDVGLEAQQARSTAIVAAGESGVSGNSVDALISDINIQEARQRDRLALNQQFVEGQLQREKEGTIVQTRSRINSVQQAELRKPSLLVPLFQLAGAGMSGYAYHQERTGGSRTRTRTTLPTIQTTNTARA
jgi:hypothetical protein